MQEGRCQAHPSLPPKASLLSPHPLLNAHQVTMQFVCNSFVSGTHRKTYYRHRHTPRAHARAVAPKVAYHLGVMDCECQGLKGHSHDPHTPHQTNGSIARTVRRSEAAGSSSGDPCGSKVSHASLWCHAPIYELSFPYLGLSHSHTQVPLCNSVLYFTVVGSTVVSKIGQQELHPCHGARLRPRGIQLTPPVGNGPGNDRLAADSRRKAGHLSP